MHMLSYSCGLYMVLEKLNLNDIFKKSLNLMTLKMSCCVTSSEESVV